VWCRATTSQKQAAGCDYDCDGFSHGMILSVDSCVRFHCRAQRLMSGVKDNVANVHGRPTVSRRVWHR
jgi:hypothetical protein